MVLFVVFAMVVGLWIMRSVVISISGAEWFIEMNHGDTLPQADKVMKTVKVLGLVFIAFVAPLMFLAGTIAAGLLYFGALRQEVNKAKLDYELAEAELEREVAEKATGEKA